MIAADGHEELPDRRWRIAVTTDQPPAIHLEEAPTALAADTHEVVIVRAEDDVGIRAATVKIRRHHHAGEFLTQLMCTTRSAPPELSDDSRQQCWNMIILVLALENGPTQVVPPEIPLIAQRINEDPIAWQGDSFLSHLLRSRGLESGRAGNLKNLSSPA